MTHLRCFLTIVLLSTLLNTVLACNVQNIFIWRFKNAQLPPNIVYNLEGYFEDAIKQPQFNQYFHVHERRNYRQLHEISKTEEFISPGVTDMLKASRVNVVVTGELSYIVARALVEVRIQLTSLENSQIIASGYTDFNINEVENRTLIQEKYITIINEKFIPSITYLVRQNNNINTVKEANEYAKNAQKCKGILIEKIRSGIMVPPFEQEACKKLEDKGIEMWHYLAEQDNLQALDSLISYYNKTGLNQDLLTKLRRQRERLISSQDVKASCISNINYAKQLLDSGSKCTEALHRKLLQGFSIGEDSQKRCYALIDEGLELLHFSKETGCIEAIGVLIDFYKTQNCQKCNSAVSELELLKKNLLEQNQKY